MAAELGFEPRQTESESAVLPLHNSAPLYLLYPFLENCQDNFQKSAHFIFFSRKSKNSYDFELYLNLHSKPYNPIKSSSNSSGVSTLNVSHKFAKSNNSWQ